MFSIYEKFIFRNTLQRNSFKHNKMEDNQKGMLLKCSSCINALLKVSLYGTHQYIIVFLLERYFKEICQTQKRLENIFDH